MGGESKHERAKADDDLLRTSKPEGQSEQTHAVGLATPAAQATTIAGATLSAAPSSPGLAGPPRIELGDHAVGTTHHEDLNVFNTEANDAYVRVSYEGSPSVALVSAPSRLRPSKEGLDPAAVIRLAFSPTAKGRAHGTIVVHAEWQLGIRAPVDLRIPVEAAAHEVGGMPLAEEDAEESARKEEERQQQREHDELARADQRRREGIESNERLPGGDGRARMALERAHDHVKDALSDLFDNRRTGVDIAEKEAAKFNRRPPEHEENLLLTLAFAALDLASVGLAGALGKAVEGALASRIKNKAIVAFFTDSVKDVAKQGAKAGTGALKGKQQRASEPEASHDPGASSDPLIAFFQTERLSLIPQGRAKATAVAERTFDELEPLLASPAERMKAVDAMEAIATNVRKVVNREEPANKQADASRMHWIQYVAQTSLGTVTAEESRAAGKRTLKHGESTTNLEGANTAPTSRGAPSAHDGLLDLEFEADPNRAETPGRVVRARIHGVSNAIATKLAEAALLTAGVPVRAYSRPGSSTLEVVRDEAGNVDYVDNTGAPGMPGNWFERKVGEPRGGRDAALRGARKLMEQELMASSLNDIGVAIATDSDDK
jgi:hypothetical protein